MMTGFVAAGSQSGGVERQLGLVRVKVGCCERVLCRGLKKTTKEEYRGNNTNHQRVMRQEPKWCGGSGKRQNEVNSRSN